VGTGLLSIPAATESGHRAHFVDALFTATSAVCVTGLSVVDIATYWSTFGEIVILLLIQIGGLGIMALATIVMALVSRRVGLGVRFLAQAETRAVGLGHVVDMIRNIVVFSLLSELVIAVVLTARAILGYHDPPLRAIHYGVFHSITAFNNVGFSPYSDNLMRFVADPWVTLPICAGVIVGGIGFPVVFELFKLWRHPSRWSVMTRLVLATSALLLAAGTVVLTLTEWSNPETMGVLSDGEKVLAGFFTSTVARTGGFNILDLSELRSESLLVIDVLMFIGGGSGGTAGGIKVTTFGLLAYAVWAEMRGQTHVTVGKRRIPATTQRQALSVALLGLGTVIVATFLMLSLTRYRLELVLFETISAFATVGLSTGITPDLPTTAQLLLVFVMFLGRTGPLTLASALALRDRGQMFELPEERTIVG
jgi:trk system potassium uptake protein TrkH